ncbi:MAG: hypothetical protein JST84_03975 [Acidobacteria bacterium]|nr:hypothetical protein [Acidobacteriota bacterium]
MKNLAKLLLLPTDAATQGGASALPSRPTGKGEQMARACLWFLLLLSFLADNSVAETPIIKPTDVDANSSGGRICFRVDSPDIRLTGPYPTFRTGHAFVALQPDTGPQKGNSGLVYGHVPEGGTLGGINPFSSKGKTEGQADHPWDYQICYHLSAAQYNAAAAFIRGEITSPSDFHLFTRNCTDWIDKVAAAAGVHIPLTTDDPNRRGIKDPAVFEGYLENLLKGKRPKGKKARLKEIQDIRDNVGPTFEKGKVEKFEGTFEKAHQFDACSCQGLDFAATIAPQKLASGLKLEVNVQTLPEVQLGVGQPLSIELQNVDPENALISMHFNNKDIVRRQPSAIYKYDHSSTFPIQVVIITPGRVNLFSFQAVVSTVPKTQTTIVGITVPSPSP